MKICCIDGCNNPCVSGRRYCRTHYLERHRKQAHDHYVEYGRHMYYCTCTVCGMQYRGNRYDARYCPDCYNAIRTFRVSTDENYKFLSNGNTQHKQVALDVYGLKETEVVHHIDGDVKNNRLDNLAVMTRKDHSRLHFIIRKLCVEQHTFRPSDVYEDALKEANVSYKLLSEYTAHRKT